MKIVLDNTDPVVRLGVTSGPSERVLTTARRRRFGRVIQVTNPALKAGFLGFQEMFLIVIALRC
jgi:hypothetical protein